MTPAQKRAWMTMLWTKSYSAAITGQSDIAQRDRSDRVSHVHRAAPRSLFFFFFNDTATTEIYTLSLHDALPIFHEPRVSKDKRRVEIRSRDLRIEREHPFGPIAAAVRRRLEELGQRGVELEGHRFDVVTQRVPGAEAVLACDDPLRIVQSTRLAGLHKLLRLTFELIEVGTGGELLGCHKASMLNAGGPQAGQHGDNRAVNSIKRVDSV